MHYKKWRKTQARRDAVDATKARVLTAALEYTPPSGLVVGELESPAAIGGAKDNADSRNGDEAESEPVAEVVDAADMDHSFVDEAPEDSVGPTATLVSLPLTAPGVGVARHLALDAPATSCLPKPGSSFPFPLWCHQLCGPALVSSGSLGQPSSRGGPQQKRQRRHCAVKGCRSPSDCPGAYNRSNCVSLAGSKPSRRAKRAAPKPFKRRCRTAGCPDPENCPGKSSQSRCLGRR